MPVKIISSPLNYTGGKSKLLSQLLPLFPNEVSTFVDIFCGGCNVAINASAENYICNDINSNLVGLLQTIKNISSKKLITSIKSIISKYSLSDSTTNGYNYYNCQSSSGLGKYNKERFFALRNDFNSLKTKNENYFIKLFVLIIFSFNNQIRFNTEGNFNLPVGKRDLNSKMQEKVINFATVLQTKNMQITNSNFSTFNLEILPQNSFIYADPPYLITCASYNEKNGWTEEDEIKLLNFLDNCNSKKINFALSNVLETDGKENKILKEWLSDNKMYICHHLDYSYKNSNYHKKNSTAISDEVLVTNYEV